MYRYLWSNGPKECLEFADYSFLEHFGTPIPSYPPRAVLLDYMNGRLEKNGGLEVIKYNHVVRWVTFNQINKTFNIIACNLSDGPPGVMIQSEFDFIICAIGHYSTPNIPTFDEMNTFPGRVLHSHDFRSADEFKGKHVLCVGSSYSAEDIGSQCLKYGANTVSFSYRTKPMRFRWPETVTTFPLLHHVHRRNLMQSSYAPGI